MSGQLQLIYIHGFNSSPESKKAVILREAAAKRGLQQYCHVPKLPFAPQKSLQILEETIARCDGKVCLVGSSMGGFYAINLAHKYDIKAVLVNPAMDPHLLLKDRLGEMKNDYTGEEYQFTVADIKFFKSIWYEQIRYPQRFLTLLQTADETLDYLQAESRLSESSVCRQVGGSHGFDHFQDFVPLIFRFLNFDTQ